MRVWASGSAGICVVAPALETAVLCAGITVVTFFELGAFLRRAIGLGVVFAYAILSAAIYRTWVPVVTRIVVVTIFGAIDGEMDADSRDCVTAVRRATVVVVTFFIYDT